ncbi:MAG: DUF2179 domain-containing protein [Candidatus Aminicenantes bacterium]|jgi:uncharacterized protein YebE (UPF0316 family)
MNAFTESGFFIWVVLPFLIFFARVVDVTLGTMRIVFISRGLKYLAPLVGFVEVIIWLLAIRVIMQNLNNALCYIAYGAGFAMGNFIGIYLEKKMAVGRGIIRIITRKDATELVDVLRQQGFGVTNLVAKGSLGDVNVIFMVIRRADFKKIVGLVQKYNPQAFYTLEDVRYVCEGVFPTKENAYYRNFLGPFKYFRKGK